MAKKILKFLESVLADNQERNFGSIDGKSKVKIPLLITKKTDKNVTRYSTDFAKIASFEGLKTNPNRIQMQNSSQAALLYSLYTALGDSNPDIQNLNKAVNVFHRGGTIDGNTVKRFSVDAEKHVNAMWKAAQDGATTEQKARISDDVQLLTDRAINEMHEAGELKAADITIEKSSKIRNLMLKAFQSNLIHSKNTPMTTSHEVSEIYSNTPDKIKEFLEQRYGSSNKEDYLFALMSNHASDIQDLCDSANLKFDSLINLIKFVQPNSKADESNGISNSDYRNARISSKKNAKGKITAYIKEDEQFKGVHHLLINVTHYEGQANHSNSLLLLSHNELATDLHSPNLLGKYLKQTQDVSPLLNEKRLAELQQQRVENEELQRQSAQRLMEENEQKRLAAIEKFEQATPVTSADQLEGTYFAQKSAAYLAVKYIPNMRLDGDNNIWIPLANVADSDPKMSNIEGFQRLLPEKDPILETNKLFEGIGEGRKNKASATLGDIDNASLIIESEGIVNGLIAIEMAEQKGLKVAAVCGLDVGNLPHTLGRALKHHPTKPIINLADNDLFNSDRQRRYLPHELAALNIPESGKTVNVGLKRAAEMTNAVNVPHIYFDFANDFGDNLEHLQQEQKGSDIDDALNIVYQNLADKGGEAPHIEAWETVKESLFSKIETTLKYHVSPHWSVETQDRYSWCPSTDNLGKEGLQDFYHLKDIIDGVNQVFEKNHQMSYETYRHLVSTHHDPQYDQNVDIDESVLTETNEQVDALIEESTKPAQTETVGEQIESEPLVQLDAEIPHLVAPTINESTIYVDTKIHSITRKLDNLAATANEWLQYENSKRVDKHMATLHKLVDEKSRLLGISARQIQGEPQLAVYFDREREIQDAQVTAAQQVDFVPSEDDWLELAEEEENRTIERDNQSYDYQLENPNDVESSAPSDKTNKQLLDEVLNGQTAQAVLNETLKEEESIEAQTVVEVSDEDRELAAMYEDFLAEVKDSLDEYLEQPHSDSQKHYDALAREVMAIDATMNHLSTIYQNKSSKELQSDLGLDPYYAALDSAKEALKPQSLDTETKPDIDELLAGLTPVTEEPTLDEPVAEQTDLEPETPVDKEPVLNQTIRDIPTFDSDSLDLPSESELNEALTDKEFDDFLKRVSEQPSTVSSQDEVLGDIPIVGEHEKRESDLPTQEANEQATGFSNSDLAKAFTDAIKAMSEQNQTTLSTVTSMIDKVMNQQTSMMDRQNVMFDKLLKQQEAMLEKQTEMVNGMLRSQERIVATMQQSNGRQIQSDQLVQSIDSSPQTSQEPSQDSEPQPSALEIEREELQIQIASIEEKITAEKRLHTQLDTQIDKMPKVAPRNLQSAVDPQNTAQSSSQPNGEHQAQLVEFLRASIPEIDNGYRHAAPSIKEAFGTFLQNRGLIINLDSLKNETRRTMNGIHNAVAEIYGDATFRRGLPMSIALGEAVRNSTDTETPPSAIVAVCAAAIKGEEVETSRPANALINGEINISEYYKDCLDVLGEVRFEQELQDEYDEYVRYHQPRQQTVQQQQEPESFLQPEI